MDFHEIYIDGEREECFCDSGMQRRSIPLELHNLECRKWWNPTSVALKILEKFPVGNIVNFHSDQ